MNITLDHNFVFSMIKKTQTVDHSLQNCRNISMESVLDGSTVYDTQDTKQHILLNNHYDITVLKIYVISVVRSRMKKKQLLHN